jgi:hypothetical protein
VNELAEMALVQILSAWPGLAALVANRITWDDTEIDIDNPAVRLRTLAAPPASRDLGSRGGLRRCLVEVSCDDDHSTGASKLCDAVTNALEAFESGPFSVFVSGTEARFGSIALRDVFQGRSLRERTHRKTATVEVWVYE